MAGVALGGTTGVVLDAIKAVPCGVDVGEGGTREAVAAGSTGVCVGAGVFVGICMGVGVSVGVAVGVGVRVGHAVSVGTGVGQVFVTRMGTTCKTLLSTSPVPPTSLTAALR